MDGFSLTSIKLTTPFSHSSQTYSLFSHLHSQKYRKLYCARSLHPPSQQPPQLFWSNGHSKHQRVGSLQLVLNLHSNPTTPWHSIPFPPLRSPPTLPKWGNFAPPSPPPPQLPWS